MDFHGLMTRRFACKQFRKDRTLSPDQVGQLLEIGRLSPSSFGIEAWHFVAVTSPGINARLGAACGGQEAVSSASCVIVTLFPPVTHLYPGSDFLVSRAERFPGGWKVFKDDYQGYFEFLRAEGRLEHWARAQTYIPCANMMTGAASFGVDSCAIEGFDESGVLEAIGWSDRDWKVGILASFGYAAEACRVKIREPIDSVSDVMN